MSLRIFARNSEPRALGMPALSARILLACSNCLSKSQQARASPHSHVELVLAVKLSLARQRVVCWFIFMLCMALELSLACLLDLGSLTLVPWRGGQPRLLRDRVSPCCAELLVKFRLHFRAFTQNSYASSQTAHKPASPKRQDFGKRSALGKSPLSSLPSPQYASRTPRSALFTPREPLATCHLLPSARSSQHAAAVPRAAQRMDLEPGALRHS